MSIATPLDKEEALGSTHMCTLCTLHYNNTLSSQLFQCRNNPFHESLKLIFRAPFPISPRIAGAESSWFQKQNHWENNKFIISRGEQNRIIFSPCLVKQSGMAWKTFSTALLVTLELLRTSIFTSPVLRCHTACQEITDHVCHQLIHASGWSWEDEWQRETMLHTLRARSLMLGQTTGLAEVMSDICSPAGSARLKNEHDWRQRTARTLFSNRRSGYPR